MPLYADAKCWEEKAQKVLALVLDTGNFGQGRNYDYKKQSSFGKRLVISFGRHLEDFLRRFAIFPMDACRAWCKTLMLGVKFAVGGGGDS
jgi:hypothetical protein